MSTEKQQDKGERTKVSLLKWGTGNKEQSKESAKETTTKVIAADQEQKERATFYLHGKTLLNLKRATYWDREESQGDVIEKALALYWKDRTFEPTPKEEK
jgi:hypothetical protein